MNTEQYITVSGVRAQIVRKNIRNLHFSVYPPNGRVRVAAPLRASDEDVRLALAGKIGWIKKHQARFAAQPRQSAREIVSGESHYFLGQRYQLHVVNNDRTKVTVLGDQTIELHVRPEANLRERRLALQEWYREKLKELLPSLVAIWQPRLGVQVAEWRIKKMKTRWGTCNIRARRIWINLELARKPVRCLEYIIVHEMMHLLARRHDSRFKALMDKYLPQWRLCRDELKRTPIMQETDVF
jgi:predicted metal-dependent hydrolase